LPHNGFGPVICGQSGLEGGAVAELITQRADQLAVLPIFADYFAADLYPLAALLQPLHAAAGEVLMRQGETAHTFLIIGSGTARIIHEEDDGTVSKAPIETDGIIGEIALLQNTVRVATVVAAEEIRGWIGGDDAFAQLLDLPRVLPKLLSTARQRLAAFITPIPVRMRDASDLFLRPVLPGDNARAVHGHVEFSAETFYRRFMSAREPTAGLMQYLFEVDYVEHFVWVLTETEDGEIVADARFVRDHADSSTAEIAFIVGDNYQGRGIGSFLMKALIVAAHTGGVETFTARVLSENMAMRRILDRYGASWEREDLGVVTTVIAVPALKEVRLPTELVSRISEVARQVTRAVG
jgi:protein lysine acetyltransferase